MTKFPKLTSDIIIWYKVQIVLVFWIKMCRIYLLFDKKIAEGKWVELKVPLKYWMSGYVYMYEKYILAFLCKPQLYREDVFWYLKKKKKRHCFIILDHIFKQG